MQGRFEGRHVVVTGGTGALGGAVVASLLAEGASCHVPWLFERELERFAFSDHARVSLTGPIQLTDEAAVVAYYSGLPALWASVHIAGGFAMAPLTETSWATTAPCSTGTSRRRSCAAVRPRAGSARQARPPGARRAGAS